MSKTKVGKLFSLKDQRVNIWVLVDLMVSFTMTQLCHWGEKVAVDNSKTNRRGCASIKLYLLKEAAGQISPTGHSLPNPGGFFIFLAGGCYLVTN